jgi:hypothetical protein
VRITESRLRRVIRSVIAESFGHESLKDEMLKIIEDLRMTLEDCQSPRDCAVEINLATGRMADAWNMAGERNTGGPFVQECSVGVLMNKMQTSALEGTMMDLQSFLSEVESEINKCDFSELSGYSGTDRVRQHISSTVNNPGAMGPNESVLRRAVRKELNRR